MLFGILWIAAWLEYTCSFVVMVSASTYYFDSNSGREGSATVCKGFKFAYLNHMGSIACGSLIIATVRLIKFIFLYAA